MDLPPIKTTSDLPEVFTALLLGGCGDLTPGEAGRLAALVGEAGRAIELHDLEVRLQRLEEQQAQR